MGLFDLQSGSNRKDPNQLVSARERHPWDRIQKADEVAHKLRISRDSTYRACAGVEHILVEAIQEGHCALPNTELLAKAIELLEVDPLVVEQALSCILKKGDVILERIKLLIGGWLFASRGGRREEFADSF